MKRLTWFLVFVGLLAGCGGPAVERRGMQRLPKNVVLIVGDGFGVGAWTLARAWAQAIGERTVFDSPEALGFLLPNFDGGYVTDSAAAATAWSCGRLVPRFQVGVEGVQPLLVQLTEAGWACGVVTNTRITHGTPAPFYSIGENRDLEDELAPQLVRARLAVALGGGARNFLPASSGGVRADERDVIEEAKAAGFAVLTEFHAPLPVDQPVIGVFAASHLPHEVDRGDGPSLTDMTVAAIRRLEAERRPWFLVVEEGRVDQAAHDFDGPSVAFDGLRLDQTVRAVLDMTERATTLVVVLADHATTSPAMLESADPESLRAVRASVESMEREIFEGKDWKGTPDALEEKALPVVDRGAELTKLRPEDLDRLVSAKGSYDRAAALGLAVSRKFGITFIPYDELLGSRLVHGHTGDLVPIRAWGPRASDVVGVRDHASVGRWLREITRLTPAAASGA